MNSTQTRLSIIIAALLTTTACASSEPGVEIRTVEVVKTIQAPCPGPRPERPEPLGPLPTDAIKLAALLGAKLAEWSGPGAFGDRADAIFSRCLTE